MKYSRNSCLMFVLCLGGLIGKQSYSTFYSILYPKTSKPRKCLGWIWTCAQRYQTTKWVTRQPHFKLFLCVFRTLSQWWWRTSGCAPWNRVRTSRGGSASRSSPPPSKASVLDELTCNRLLWHYFYSILLYLLALFDLLIVLHCWRSLGPKIFIHITTP